MALSTPPPGGGDANDFKKLLEKLNNLEIFCCTLKQENESLKHELAVLKNEPHCSKSSEDPSDIQYVTDEDELQKETEWILKGSQRKNKKRKMQFSPENHTSASKEVQKILEERRPPPIILSVAGKSYQDILTMLKENVKKDFLLKLISKDSYKINLFDSIDYRTISKILNNSQSAWYSYENKQTRQIRVMVKDLHYSCDPNDIVADLIQQGFKATNAINKLKWKTKEPLNMFIVSFDTTEDIKNIYEIKQILKTVVKVEPIKPTKLIPQCKSCQEFQHTKNYCCKPPRCVKCTGNHPTVECDKPNTVLPKCCNCGGNHPANYRGCSVAKKIQKIRNKTLASRNLSTNRANVRRVTSGETFASVAAERINPTKNHAPTNDDKFSQILNKLNEQIAFNQQLMHRIEKLEQNKYA